MTQRLLPHFHELRLELKNTLELNTNLPVTPPVIGPLHHLLVIYFIFLDHWKSFYLLNIIGKNSSLFSCEIMGPLEGSEKQPPNPHRLKTKAPAEPPIVPGIPLPINYLIQP